MFATRGEGAPAEAEALWRVQSCHPAGVPGRFKGSTSARGTLHLTRARMGVCIRRRPGLSGPLGSRLRVREGCVEEGAGPRPRAHAGPFGDRSSGQGQLGRAGPWEGGRECGAGSAMVLRAGGLRARGSCLLLRNRQARDEC